MAKNEWVRVKEPSEVRPGMALRWADVPGVAIVVPTEPLRGPR